ncbi:ATP-binding cassette domain-containing protein [Exiguobacterium sp. SH3S2]|uniref:ABC transporter ATP-binding protein n=1 Tax=unclassified Exiguobacterium TaxID=2644629 RepID=UPI001039908B|nr:MULTISPECIES: ABC transporter transmembrane domain-containing protein [unclassified Exiguobacterium]TCI24571.1 ATP-binding cassette domain-containing protein [Exiguobacterium sp. SH5S4]TCI46405.1 ATP-binding cassette domain-containing protein [Exiguobacterium sp. SH3S3]TCI57134.1 ATP-binding cassette domain-containing protein [Exiguobacterium sp. SH5S13]TCI62047.1 ATP-binding cassette domain-containing protein [Exiguobacterium sp. SH3S2]
MKHDIQEWAVIKRLLAYTKRYGRPLSLAFVFLLLATGAKLAGPFLIKVFIDEFVTPGVYPTNWVVTLLVVYMVLHISAVIFDYLQSIAFQKIALKIVQNIRMDIFRHVMGLRLAYFDRTPAGVLVSRITNDTEAVKELYVGVMSTFVQSGVQLLGTYIFLYILEPTLATIGLVLLPLFWLIIWAYRRYSTKYFAQVRDLLSRLNAQLSESINGMGIVQQFRQEERLVRQFEATNEAHQEARFKNLKLDSMLLRPIIELLLAFSIIGLLGYYGFLSMTEQVQVGVVYAFISYIERIFRPVLDIMQRLSEFQQAVVSADRVFKVLDTDEPAPGKSLSGEAAIGAGEVRFDDVTFSYDGEVDVLKNISFVAKPGETVALVGHTGSGKSSIINLLTRFYPYEGGQITIDGHPLEQFEEVELRDKIGLVLQDPFLFSGTIEDNLKLFNPTVNSDKVRQSAEFVQANTFIEKLEMGYGHAVGERGATFSSGERQLLAFARTVARDPKILILDEATSSIDTETEERVQFALDRMRRGRTTIAIAHRLSTIQDADLILVLHRGEIVERGNHQALLKHDGLYKKMYELQSGQRLMS